MSIIISLMMIYITQINYKNKILNKVTYIIWNLVWILIIFVSLRPGFLDDYFENKYDIDIFYILSVLSTLTLIILYYFSFLKINILEKKINTLIQSDSLKDIFQKIKD